MDDWREWAACRGMDPDLFIEPFHEVARTRATREAKARAVCDRCPVVIDCLGEALSNDEKHGIWGGMNRREREELATQLAEAM